MHQLSLRKILWILVGIVAIWLGIRYFLPVFLPFLLAGVLALAAQPLVRSLEKHFHFPHGVAAFTAMTVVLLLAVLILLALCALLIRELGALAEVLPDLENATTSGLDSLEDWLLGIAEKAPGGIRPILIHGVEGIFSSGNALLDRLSEFLLNLATSVVKALPDSALGIGTWVLASYMLCARLPKIRTWLREHIPAAWRQMCRENIQMLKKTVLRWLWAQTKLVGITFCILLAGFLLLRIPHGFLWAIATCFVDILPVLGTGTVLIPWSVVCFLQGDTLQGVGLLVIYGIITFVRSMLEPRFVGKQLGLDSLLTLLAIYAGYRLWGLLGMLFAPILAVIASQILLQRKK